MLPELTPTAAQLRRDVHDTLANCRPVPAGADGRAGFIEVSVLPFQVASKRNLIDRCPSRPRSAARASRPSRTR